MKNVTVAIITFLALGVFVVASVSAGDNEKLTTKDGKEYVGWELKDSFLTCQYKYINKSAGEITSTKQTCPEGPGFPQPTAYFEGTVASSDAATKDIVIKDSNGKERQIFVPKSKDWSFVVAKPGDKVWLKTNLGNRLESFRLPGSFTASDDLPPTQEVR